jgi:hypothetical protein
LTRPASKGFAGRVLHPRDRVKLSAVPATSPTDPPATRTTSPGQRSPVGRGTIMAMWQMIVGAIARDPTAVPGIHTTFWTPVEGIWSVIFGVMIAERSRPTFASALGAGDCRLRLRARSALSARSNRMPRLGSPARSSRRCARRILRSLSTGDRGRPRVCGS